MAVGNAAIDATPEWLKSFAIRTFGANDKRALMIGMIVVIAVLAVVLGIVSMRRPRVGLYGLMVLGAVGAIAAFNRPTGSVLSVIPSIGGAFAASYVLRWLLRAAQPQAAPPDATPVPTLRPRCPATSTGAGSCRRRSWSAARRSRSAGSAGSTSPAASAPPRHRATRSRSPSRPIRSHRSRRAR